MKKQVVQLFVALLISMTLVSDGFAQHKWRVHDLNRPKPTVVTPPQQTLPLAAPSDAIVLFDGSDLSGWEATDGSTTKWVVKNGNMESVAGAGYIQSKLAFGDMQLHVEWAAPVPVKGDGQGRGNSGVFLMSHYEVQVLDSYNNETYADGQAASVYGQYPPLVNASRPPGEWQAYDIIWTRPRFGTGGNVISPARVTVFHNGVLVQNNVELWGGTEWLQYEAYKQHADRLPLRFQDHGNPVLFRNIWVRDLEMESEKTTMPPQRQMNAAMLDKYMGVYRIGNVEQYTFRKGKDGVEVTIGKNRTFEVIPVSKTVFEMKNTAGTFTFTLDADDNPTELVWEMGGSVIRAKKK